MTAGKMRIQVDADKCQGHNRCKALAPELFDLDEFGNATAANGGGGASRIGGKSQSGGELT